MPKALQNCSECETSHVPKGGKPCPYVVLAKEAADKCKASADWKLYFNSIDTYNEFYWYLGTNGIA